MGKQVQLGISRRKGGYVLHNPQGNVMTHNNEHRGIPPPPLLLNSKVSFFPL